VTDPYEWRAMAEIIAPQNSSTVRLRSPVERYVIIRRWLRRIASERPVIVWLDDAHWGAESIGFVRNTLKVQSREPAPILFVLTVLDDGLDNDALGEGMLKDLVEMSSVRRHQLQALSRASRNKLVGRLLGLQPELAAQVVSRSGGNPLFAVELVGDWVARGFLEVGERGFVLRPGVDAELPDNIHELWISRLQQVLANCTPDWLLALELGAILGGEIDEDEWQSVCAAAGVPFSRKSLEACVEADLIRSYETGWRFAHTMLRESLERSAADNGRLESGHSLCAAMLRSSLTPESRGRTARIGRHLLRARAFLEAVEPLLEGARENEGTSEYRTARDLLVRREEALSGADLDFSDSRWGQGWALAANVHNTQGHFDEAERLAKKCLRHAGDREGWDEVLADALRELGYVAHQRGNFDEAEVMYRDALAAYEAIESPIGEANSLIHLAQIARVRGDLADAERLAIQALEVFEELQDAAGVPGCFRNLGVIHQHLGDFAEATSLFERALDGYTAIGNRYGEATCLNDLAELYRLKGDLERAERGYRKSLKIFRQIGSTDGLISQINLALVLLLEQKYAEARVLLERTGKQLQEGGRNWFLGAVHAAMLSCAADASDWSQFDLHCEQAATLLTDSYAPDGDVAWTLQHGGDLAANAGEVERAARAYDMAKSQWEGLGQSERVAELEALIATQVMVD
ncbi:MAG: tetratricopeptide repeat protein, partial [Myxococcales bacterium]|nr:tetratricopeptide repeat protein [Myxococcales bacterium]